MLIDVRKEEGGLLCFLDLHGFNLAMLGKQGWKFISHPDTMVTRFFANCSHFECSEFGAIITDGKKLLTIHQIIGFNLLANRGEHDQI